MLRNIGFFYLYNIMKLPFMYLTNKELYYQVVVSKAQGKRTKELDRMFLILGKNIIKKMSYKSLEDKEDCLHTGLLDLYMRWYRFDEERFENAFAYYTEIFKRGMAKGFNSIKSDTISIESQYEGKGMNI